MLFTRRKKTDRVKQSAGVLLYKIQEGKLLVLLVHPGGPFWAKKDEGAWTIPKGEPAEGEDLLVAAKREFFEETGHVADGNFIPLTSLKQKGGKLVHAWGLEGELDAAAIKSNEFEIEWPPRSGKLRSFPENDRAQWFNIQEALVKILASQQGFINELRDLVLS